MQDRPKLAQAEIVALRIAYEQAIYEVYYDQETIQINIGQNCPPLDSLIAQSDYAPRSLTDRPTWALITAANPYSQPLSARENQRRDRRLSKHLRGLQLPLIPAMGKDPTGVWTPEPSWLILGITRPKAIAIGQKFEQNAIVYGELNQAAELQWL
ncbi:MAG: hypothetical protein RLZZ499_1319 [Cyanobacteriota bacterium]